MRVKLEEVVDRITGNVDRFNTDLIYYIGGEHYESSSLAIYDKGLLGSEKGQTLGFKFHFPFKAGDVLFMARNPHLRKAGMVNFDGICSDASYILRTKDESKLLQRYLPLVIQNDKMWDFFEANKSGSVNYLMNWKELKNYEFDLPDIDEQARLSEIAWKMESVRKAYYDLLTETDNLVKSQFIEMFGDPHKVISEAKYTVSDIADVQVGLVIKPTRFYSNTETPYPAFRSLNIGTMEVRDTEWVYFTEAGMKENQRTITHTGDVLVVRSGYPGTSCVVTPEYDGRNVVDLVIAHPDPSKILPEFLCAYTNYPHGKMQIEANQRGVAQKHFNVSMYNAMKIIVPDMDEQLKFVSLLKQTDKSKFELKAAIEKLEKAQAKFIFENC